MQSALTLLAASSVLASAVNGQVTATFPNGVTNPDQPSLGTAFNQSSMARLLTLNSIDDFCLFGPPEEGPDSLIGNVEPIVVAYCLQQRNDARLIPDGTITAAHFVKTPLYVQIQGFFDGTKINIPYGDDGGELDPHGAENLGNPIGGNVTSNVSGSDVFYEEWMSFMSYNMFCLRICTAESDNITAALQCEHELDVMGCQFVMPGDYTNNSFTSCEGEPAAAPGHYLQPNGSTSIFKQAWTYTGPGEPWTIGQTVTPSAPAFTPATSNCQTFSTIGNGIVNAAIATPASGSSAASSMMTGASSMMSSGASSMMSSGAPMASATGSSLSRSGVSAGASVTGGASAALNTAAASASSAVSNVAGTSGAFRSTSTPWALVGGTFLVALGGAAALL